MNKKQMGDKIQDALRIDPYVLLKSRLHGSYADMTAARVFRACTSRYESPTRKP